MEVLSGKNNIDRALEELSQISKKFELGWFSSICWKEYIDAYWKIIFLDAILKLYKKENIKSYEEFKLRNSDSWSIVVTDDNHESWLIWYDMLSKIWRHDMQYSLFSTFTQFPHYQVYFRNHAVIDELLISILNWVPVDLYTLIDNLAVQKWLKKNKEIRIEIMTKTERMCYRIKCLLSEYFDPNTKVLDFIHGGDRMLILKQLKTSFYEKMIRLMSDDKNSNVNKPDAWWEPQMENV